MTTNDLISLLSFEADLQDAEIISTTELNNGATLIVARLCYTGGEMTVPFIHYNGEDWIFTPRDWQQPGIDATPVDEIEWRVNDTDIAGIMLNGQPHIAPWVTVPEYFKQEARVAIGHQIKRAREAQGLTVRQLADKCGLAFGHISRIESGRYNVTVDTLAIIASALSVDITIEPL